MAKETCPICRRRITMTSARIPAHEGGLRFPGRQCPATGETLAHAREIVRATTAAITKRRKNGSEEAAAAALSEAFHGRPAKSVRDVEEIYHERLELADLGRLIELRVLVDDDHERALQFSGNVRVCSSPDGGQLYIVGGDQALDLETLGLAKYLPKDHVTVGPAIAIAYHTSKVFHNFEPQDYEHEFGEDGGELPVLGYDVQSQKLYLTGGSYQVRREGIVN